jgi:hypothetical protein
MNADLAIKLAIVLSVFLLGASATAPRGKVFSVDHVEHKVLRASITDFVTGTKSIMIDPPPRRNGCPPENPCGIRACI